MGSNDHAPEVPPLAERLRVLAEQWRAYAAKADKHRVPGDVLLRACADELQAEVARGR